MDASIQITDETLNRMVEKAIMDSMTPESRENVIRQAVQELLRKNSARYDGKSEFQHAFNSAVGRVAYAVAEKQVSEDQAIIAEMKALFSEAWEKLMTAGEMRQKMIDDIASSLRKGMTGDRY